MIIRYLRRVGSLLSSHRRWDLTVSVLALNYPGRLLEWQFIFMRSAKAVVSMGVDWRVVLVRVEGVCMGWPGVEWSFVGWGGCFFNGEIDACSCFFVSHALTLDHADVVLIANGSFGLIEGHLVVFLGCLFLVVVIHCMIDLDCFT